MCTNRLQMNLDVQARIDDITKYKLNKLRSRQNGQHFPDDILKWIFVNENACISFKISLEFIPGGQRNNSPALIRTMACRRPGDKALSEPMVVKLPNHIWFTRPQCGSEQMTDKHISTSANDWVCNQMFIEIYSVMHTGRYIDSGSNNGFVKSGYKPLPENCQSSVTPYCITRP